MAEIPSATEITQLLNEPQKNDEWHRQLYAAICARCRAIAAKQLAAQQPGHSLQPTLLVNDVFMKLVVGGRGQWTNSEQFFCMVATAMRQIIVDHARKRLSIKGGRDFRRVEIEGDCEVRDRKDAQQVLVIDDLVSTLETEYPEVMRVFVLHYFGGWELKEIAETILPISYPTAKRHWKEASTLLKERLRS